MPTHTSGIKRHTQRQGKEKSIGLD